MLLQSEQTKDQVNGRLKSNVHSLVSVVPVNNQLTIKDCIRTKQFTRVSPITTVIICY